MQIKVIHLVVATISALLSSCTNQQGTDLVYTSEKIIEINEDGHPLRGAKLHYSSKTFLIDASPSLEFSPDQGPILYNHIELSPRVFVGPITEQINKAYPLALTLPLQRNHNNSAEIYVLGWGDDGWVKFESIAQTNKSVTIEVTEILYDPFVAVVDK